ncbi:hypothetical protein [Bradyrhizobium sp. LB5.2]|uniref:hypothetical protein n=1 Tax=Bradyrhizobium sp. LB5.2 TaxID=3156329 RepID=UPI003392D055
MSNAVSTARQRGRAPAASEQNVIPAAPHPIYGKTINCFTLARQGLPMLEFLYLKARALKERVRDKDAETYGICCSAQREIFDAIVAAKPANSSEVARQLNVIAVEATEAGTTAVVGLCELTALAEHLNRVTAPLQPKKKVGALRRGRRLTQFGLIHRYQAFLLQELQTIGWHVYGERDYPLRYRPEDGAVSKRCATPDSRGRHPIFHNPQKLTARARSVLCALKVDTQNAEVDR